MRRAVILCLLITSCNFTKKEIRDLRTFEYSGGDVRSGSIAYPQNPPAGGAYNAFWQSCGVYTSPIYDEYAVHSLARGAIWITYKAGLEPDRLEKLKELLDKPIRQSVKSSETKNVLYLLSPRENLPANIVVTAWNAQISVEDAGDKRIRQFIDKFGDNINIPEYGMGCTNGFKSVR